MNIQKIIQNDDLDELKKIEASALNKPIYGDSPIEYAVMCRSYRIAEYIVRHIKPSTDNAFIYAAACGYLKMLDLLLSLGIDPDVRDYDLRTAAHWVAQENHIKCLKRLIDGGCNINLLDSSGQSPLYIASGEGHFYIALLLLKSGAKVDLTTDTSPFQIACAFNHYRVCNLLLKYGADIDFKDGEGRTALFYAKVREDNRLYNYLKNNGANENAVDCCGISISDLNNEELRQKLYYNLFGDGAKDASDDNTIEL